MDDELLRRVYHYLFCDGICPHTRRCRFSDALIVLIELFRVMGNLSAMQCLRRSGWPVWSRRLKFPSYSQFVRRAKSAAVQEQIIELSERCRARLSSGNEKVCDGKPLLVGGFSKDPDARTGKAPGGWGRGYKLHALVDAGGAVDSWEVTALSANEGRTAMTLVGQRDLRGTLLRADGNYDCVELYAAVARAGGRMLAPRRKPGTGLGCHPQHPHRLQAIQELEGTATGLKAHDKHRNRVEQIFGRMTMVPFGLWGLPPSVRRLPRVRRWVNAKVALYHLYLCGNHRVIAA